MKFESLRTLNRELKNIDPRALPPCWMQSFRASRDSRYGVGCEVRGRYIILNFRRILGRIRSCR